MGWGGGLLARWRRLSTPARAGLALIAVTAIVLGLNLWLNRQPATGGASTIHADVLAHRSGAEVEFMGTVVDAPVSSGGHERFHVRDQMGDVLELDYNLSLGQWAPLTTGESIRVHGQLYVDPGSAGVHCLHSHTSSGCPQPGWIEANGTTYS